MTQDDLTNVIVTNFSSEVWGELWLRTRALKAENTEHARRMMKQSLMWRRMDEHRKWAGRSNARRDRKVERLKRFPVAADINSAADRSPSPADAIETADLAHDALSNMTPDERFLFVPKINGVPDSEIGATLGINRIAVAQRRLCAKKRAVCSVQNHE